MILNVATLFWRLNFIRTIPVETRLLTWECMTTFDEIPAQAELENLFEKEFPRTCLRLKECGGFYRIWHLVSFNSSEGRRSRFLVALVESPLVNRRRALPRQIYLTAVADRLIRESSASGANDGNYLCYAHVDGCLCLLVFFEGRLCHWSEDFVRSQAMLDQALSRLRRFLEGDALFSRAKHFEEINLLENDESVFSQALFKRASRDPFWRGRDLRKTEEFSTKGVSEVVGALLGRKIFWLTVFALALLLGQFLKLGEKWRSDSLSILKDVVPPELSIPELSFPEISSERNAVENLRQKTTLVKSSCVLPEFLLKGVVGEKFAMVSVENERPRAFALGDSLGSFEVRAVGREHVKLSCGDSSIVKKVGSHGF